VLFVLAFCGATSTTFNSTLALCPNSCSCSLFKFALFVHCLPSRQNVSSEQLSEQLDSLLSSNQTYGHLTRLNITNSPLTRVPRSVCRLTTLTQLRLDNNRLTRLPDNCLPNLTALTSLSSSRNIITELQDGLFDGLHNLQTLELSYNHISSIGPRVFDRLSNLWILDLSYNGITELESGVFDGLHKLQRLELKHNRISSIGSRVFGSSARLSSLRYVGVAWNNIQTLDSWPIYLGINRSVTIDLGRNRIRRFSNAMRWKDNCGMRKVHINLWLVYNDIATISDLFRGWNMTLSTSTTWCVQPQDRIWPNYATTTTTCVYLECDCGDC